MPYGLDVFGARFPGGPPRMLPAGRGFGSPECDHFDPETGDPVSAGGLPCNPSAAQGDTLPVTAVGDMLGAAEDALRAARASLVQLGIAQLNAGLGSLPQDAVDNFHTQRRQLAGRIEAFVDQVIDQADALDSFILSLPGGSLFGGSKGLQARDGLGSGARWAQELYARIPPLPYEVVPSPRAGFNPPLSSDTASFGAAVAVAPGVAIAVGVAIWIAALGVQRIVASFNATAQASMAEAQRLQVWAAGQIGQVEALRAAGLTPAQIVDALKATPPPPAPKDPMGLADVLKWGVAGVVGLGALYFVGQMIGARRSAA